MFHPRNCSIYSGFSLLLVLVFALRGFCLGLKISPLLKKKLKYPNSKSILNLRLTGLSAIKLKSVGHKVDVFIYLLQIMMDWVTVTELIKSQGH